MTALDNRFRPLADKLIAKYGTDITLTSITVGVYNPAVGATTNTTSIATVKAAIEAYTTRKDGAGMAAGLILVGDMKFIIAAVGITKPKPGDTITLNSVVYAVVRCNELWSGEQVAAYELQGRS